MSSPAPIPAAPTPTPAVTAPAVQSATRVASPATRATTTVGAKPAVAPTRPTLPPRPAAPQPAPPQPASPWAKLFNDWPASIPRRGVVINQLNEPCAFKAFMLRDGFVLFERVSPDSLGGRFVLLPFEEIAGVKFTDPLKQDAFEAGGFKGSLA